MDQSTDKSLNKMVKHAREDFSLIDIKDLAEPLKFFHKVIRTKYFTRIQRRFDESMMQAHQKYKGFEIIPCLEDFYDFYSRFYRERRTFHYLVDVKLFGKMRKQLSSHSEDLLIHSLSRAPKNRAPVTPQKELDVMLQEFKLLVEVLVDFYDRGYLYNLLDPENSKTFFKFGVKCTTLNDIIIPFFLSRLFGSLNKVSSKFFNKVVVILISKVVKINLSTWSLILPELDILFSGDNFIGKSIEKFFFSRLFNRQRGQLIFMFARLNGMLAEHLKDLEKIMDGFFSTPFALDFESFKINYEVLNAKYEEINGLKFPQKQGETLNLREICKITDFKLKAEVETFRAEQVDALQDLSDTKGINIDDLRDDEYWQKIIDAEADGLETSLGGKQLESFNSKPECSYDTYLSDFLVSKQTKARLERPEISSQNDETFSGSLMTQSMTVMPAHDQTRASKNSLTSRFTIID